MQRDDDSDTLPRLGEIGLQGFAPYLMNRIMGRYNASIRDQMAALGLTTPKMRALAVLAVGDGLQLRDLAVYAVVEPSTLSRAIAGLENDGMVRRESDNTDSRSMRVFLTDSGRAAFDSIWPQMLDSHDAMFRGIDDDEHRAFLATLHKMLRNIRKHDF